MKKNQTTDEEFSYDAVAYPGLVISQTSPDRLGAIARLRGMNPAPSEKCRLLELGCGDGINLCWLASNLPESEFVGVDLAQNHIVEAKKITADLELRNVSFFQQDVLEINKKTFGKFDYIIAHGLFSWVPEVVRERILSLYDELLNPQGVGFISYNVYPGCYQRRIVMDIMRFHTRKIANPLEKVKQGVGFVEFLTKHTNHSPVYHEILQDELKTLALYPFQNIYHNELAEINQPFYFTEFVALAEKHNLQFLSESENFPSQKDNFPPEIVAGFEKISRSAIEYEQYADFLECRRFRQTLLCKKDVALEEEVNLLKLKELYISSLLKPTTPQIDLTPDSFKEFLNFKRDSIGVRHNLTKVVLAYLVNIGAHLLKFDELIEKAAEMLHAQGIIYENLENEAENTALLLFQLYSPNAVGFHTTKSNAVDYVSEKPIARKFNRWQANRGELVVNFWGVALNVQDFFSHSLLRLLDGTRTRENLIGELTKIINSSKEIENKEVFLTKLPENLDRNLFVLAKMGFLVG